MKTNANKEKPLVSIIIPVYNSEPYLQCMLDSIAAQSYENFEVIAVDDGSRDRSIEILKRMAERDARFSFLEQENQFAGVARNNGMARSRGEYLLFLDSDDRIAPELLEKAVRKAEETQADIVVYAGATFTGPMEDGAKQKSFLRAEMTKGHPFFSRKDIPEDILVFTNPAPWNKLFRRDFVLRHHLQFQNIRNSNDVYFTKMAMALADRITAIDEILIYYRVRTQGNLQSDKLRHQYVFLEALRALEEGLRREGIYEEVEISFLRYALNMIRYEFRTFLGRSDQLEHFEKVLTDERVAGILCRAGEAGLTDHRLYKTFRGYLLACRFREHLQSIRKMGPQGAETHLVKRAPLGSDSSEKEETPSPFFSVVVPVYNDERHIGACIASLREQSYADFELIVINDGSTDDSLERILSGVDGLPRYQVYTEENCGQSVARNAGIRASRGEYVLFLDGDDLLVPDALEQIHEALDGEDVLFFNAEPFLDELCADDDALKARLKDFENYYHRSSDAITGIRGAKLLELLKDRGEYLESACFQVIRREHLQENNLWFEPGVLHEDNLFTFQCLLFAEKASYVPLLLYRRRVSAGSIMTSRGTHRNVYGLFRAYRKMQQTYYEHRAERNWIPYHRGIAMTIAGVLKAARNRYVKLDAEERLFRLGLEDEEAELFEALVEDYCKLKETNAKQKRKLDQLQKKNEKTKKEPGNSGSDKGLKPGAKPKPNVLGRALRRIRSAITKR